MKKNMHSQTYKLDVAFAYYIFMDAIIKRKICMQTDEK